MGLKDYIIFGGSSVGQSRGLIILWSRVQVSPSEPLKLVMKMKVIVEYLDLDNGVVKRLRCNGG